MNRLKETRFRKQITQIELFTKTKIYPSRISYFENGYLEPREKEKEKLARALEVDKNWLFPRENNK